MANTIEIPITPEKLAEKRKQLALEGLDVSGDQGDITESQHNITLSYNYNGSTLKIEVTHKPFYVSEHVIESKIREWFA